MAKIGTAYLEIDGDLSPLNRRLNELRAKNPTVTAEVDLDDARAQAGIKKLGSEDVTVDGNVDLDDARAVEKVEKLRSDDVTVHGNVDLDIGAAEAKIELLKRQAGGIGGGIGGGGIGTTGGGAFGGSTLQNFFSGRLLTTAVQASVPFLPTIGASAAQGVLGAGALGTGLAGAGLVGGAGILATAIPDVKGLTTAYQAYTQQQKAAATNAIQTAQQQLQASAAAKQASEQVQVSEQGLSRARVAGDQAVAGAEEQLKNAQQAETITQKALTVARQDAVRQLQDMRRAATESVTAEQQARLNLEEARRALATAAPSTSGLDMQQLRLNVTEARQALTDAHTQRKRANEDANKAERQGVSQMPQVVAAQQQLKQAHQGAADAATNLATAETQARQSVSDAKRQVSDALTAQAQQAKAASLQAKALAASNNQLGYALSQLPPKGQKVFHMLVGLKDQWKQLSKPAQNQFFGMLSDGIREAEKQLPAFSKSADSSMTALRGAFDHLLDSFNTPGFKTFLTTMTDTFAKGVGPFERGIENIAHVLERIAVASAPDVLRMLHGFQDVTHGWEESTRNAGQLQDSVHETVQQFGHWYDLTKSLGKLVAALFLANTQGARDGGDAVEGLSQKLDGWTNWIDNHHHQVNQFFGNVLDTVKILGSALGNLAQSLSPLSNAFVPISDAVVKITSALNGLKVGNVSALSALLGGLTAKSVGSRLGGLFPSGETLKGEARTAGSKTAETFGGSFTQTVQSTVGRARGALRSYFSGVGDRMGGAMVVAIGSQLAASALPKGKVTDAISSMGTSAALGYAIAGPWGALGGVALNAFGNGLSDALQSRDIAGMNHFTESYGDFVIGVGRSFGINLGQTTAETFKQQLGNDLTAAGKGLGQGTKLTSPLQGAFHNMTAEPVGLRFAGQVARGFQKGFHVSFRKVTASKEFANTWQGMTPDEQKTARQITTALNVAARLAAKHGVVLPPNAIKTNPQMAATLGRSLSHGLGLLKSNTLDGMRDITRVFQKNLHDIDKLYPQHGKLWRQAMAQNLRAQSEAIARGMKQGEIPVKQGMDKIQDLIRRADIVDPTKKQAKAFGDTWAKGLDRTKDVTKQGINNLIDELGKLPPAAQRLAGKAALNHLEQAKREKQITGDQYDQMRSAILSHYTDIADGARKKTAGMAADVSRITGALVNVVSGKDGFGALQDNINSAMKALGIGKNVNFSIKKAAKTAGNFLGGLANDLQQGGLAAKVPGSSTGDHHTLTLNGIPIARVESGEGIFVGNRNMMAAVEQKNSEIPRYAKGGMAAMIAEANKFEQHHFPYRWGGGHSSFGIQPVDCSGAVSDVLHAAGLLRAPEVSGALMHWGHPGKGPLTVYANPEHTFMSLDGRFFGTSGSNPGGGAGWVEGGYPSSYLADFVARTMDVKGGALAQKIKRVILRGPPGPLTAMGQKALDKVRGAANAYIVKHQPGQFGGGQGLSEVNLKGARTVTASWYGPTAGQGSNPRGAGGVPMKGNMFAELNMGHALGGLPYGAKIGIGVKGRSAILTKEDIGAGGPGLDGTVRAVDVWRDAAGPLGLISAGLALAKVKRLQGGGQAEFPWFGKGADFVARKPQLIGVGDRPGGERVRIGDPKPDVPIINNYLQVDGGGLEDFIRLTASTEYDERQGLTRQLGRMG